jgi:hypothetical protein
MTECNKGAIIFGVRDHVNYMKENIVVLWIYGTKDLCDRIRCSIKIVTAQSTPNTLCSGHMEFKS